MHGKQLPREVMFLICFSCMYAVLYVSKFERRFLVTGSFNGVFETSDFSFKLLALQLKKSTPLFRILKFNRVVKQHSNRVFENPI